MSNHSHHTQTDSPDAPNALNAPNARNAPDGLSLKGTIVHADDDRINRMIVAAMLTPAGYSVHAVEDGRQCLEILTEIQPDLILMDVEMPNIDGITACQRIRADKLYNDIPIIFVTSHTDDDTLQKTFDAGGTDYVRKPIGQVELMVRIDTALTQRRAIKRQRDEEILKGVIETAGAACHELNQPLQFVFGSIQLLMVDLPEEDPLYGHLVKVMARVEQMADITRKLGQITRYRTRKYMGNREIIDLEKATSFNSGDDAS
jgi:CheY-like chemotaxis protein